MRPISLPRFGALAIALLAVATAHADSAAQLQNRIRRVETALRPPLVAQGNPIHWSILERMKHYKVPAVSIAVVDHGRVEWARAYGLRDAATGASADVNTVFQAASISKVVTATATMRLVDSGRLDLDRDVNGYLVRWKLPANALTAQTPVTLRMLLSHRAGTNVHGFEGYAHSAPAIPTLVQILQGQPPANSQAVRVTSPPTAQTSYSGGGVLIEQAVLEDRTHEPFAQLVRRLVLEPLRMTRSSFVQPIDPALSDDHASSHDRAGKPVPGGFNIYPEMAAAGLWTTPTDLARLGVALQKAYSGQHSLLFSRRTARIMLSPAFGGPYGLGPVIEANGGDPIFVHGGSNVGSRALFQMSVRHGHGAVIMTNSANGAALAGEIMAAINDAYGWNAVKYRPRRVVALPQRDLERLVGTYSAGDGPTIAVSRDGDHLVLSLPGGSDGPKRVLHSESPTQFFESGLSLALLAPPGPGKAPELTLQSITGATQSVKRVEKP